MALHRITGGLVLPLTGRPEFRIEDAPPVTHVAVFAADYPGLRLTLRCAEGKIVRRGQPLLADETRPDILVTAPASGTVTAIPRDPAGAPEAVVVAIDASENASHSFAAFTDKDAAGHSDAEVKALLLESGLWTALRTRPFDRVPDPTQTPKAIFITAVDTDPLAPLPDIVVAGYEDEFIQGLMCVVKLTPGMTYLCLAPGSKLPSSSNHGVQAEHFAGPTPAGHVATHIRILSNIRPGETVWHIGYQDVLAIGHLLRTGRLPSHRAIALAGSAVAAPRLLRTLPGASLAELTAGQLVPSAHPHRVYPDGVLRGRDADLSRAYLGSRGTLVAVLREDDARALFSLGRTLRGRLTRVRTAAHATLLRWWIALASRLKPAPNPNVPLNLGACRTPSFVYPPFLLRALRRGNATRAERFGVRALGEEDMTPCELLCPAVNYRTLLNDTLSRLERHRP